MSAGYDPEARQLVELLAALAPNRFPAWAVPQEAHKLAPKLVDSGVLVADGDWWRLDERARAELREGASPEERRKWCKAGLDLMRAVFPADAHQAPSWEAAGALMPHAVAVAEDALELELAEDLASWLLERAAHYLEERGDVESAGPIARRAVAAARQAGDPILEGAARRTLGAILAELGRQAEAEVELRAALEIHERLGEDGRADAARDRTILTFPLMRQERPDEARATIDTAVEALDRDVAGDVDALVHALMMSGHAAIAAGDSERARADYGDALDLAERHLPSGHQAVAFALGGLGVALHNLGLHADAIATLQRALDAGDGILGPDHPATGVVLGHLGDSLQAVNRLSEARLYRERAVEAGERTLTGDDPELRSRHRKLGLLAERQGDLVTAQRELEAALAIAERSGSLPPAAAAADLVQLAHIASARDDRSAIALHRRALSVMEEAAASDDEVAFQHLLTGRCARDFDEPGLAATHIRAALSLFERDVEHDGLGVVACRLDLAEVVRHTGESLAEMQLSLGDAARAEEARTAARASYLAALERELESGDPEALLMVVAAALDGDALDVAEHGLERATRSATTEADADVSRMVGSAWDSLGRAHRERGNLDDAERAFQAGLPLLAGDPRLQGVVLHDLGDLRRVQDQVQEAVAFYAEAVERKRSASPGRTRDLLTSMNALTFALIDAGQVEQAAAVGRDAVDLLRETADGSPRLHARTLALTSRALALSGDLEEAHDLLEESLRLFGRDGFPVSERAATIGLLIAVSERLGRTDAGRQLLDGELERANAESALILAEVCRELGVLTLAERALGRAEELVLGGTPESSADVTPRQIGLGWHRLGRAHLGGQDLDRAWGMYSRALPLLAPVPYEHGILLHDLADVRRDQGRHDEALGLYRRAADRKRVGRTPDNDRDFAVTLFELARALQEHGDLDEARDAFEEQLARLSELPVRQPLREGLALQGIGEVLSAQQRWVEAIVFFQRALSRMREDDETKPLRLADALLELGRAHEASESFEPALEAYEERLQVLSELPQREPYQEGITLHDIGDVRRAQRRLDEAVELYRDALARKRGAADETDRFDVATTLLALATAELERGQVSQAESCAAEAASLLRAEGSDDPEQRLLLASALVIAARASTAREDASTALGLLEDADRLLEETGDVNRQEAARVKQLLAEACAAVGRDDDAEQARRQAEALMGEQAPRPR